MKNTDSHREEDTVTKDVIEYAQVPLDYLMCLDRNCPKAEHCLRQIAEQVVPAEVERLYFINPKFLKMLSGDCPYFRPAVKVRYAKGFVKLLDNLPHKQMQAVIRELNNCFKERTYYRVRKGERLLSPDEQQQVLDIINRRGVDQPLVFDAYVEIYDWE